ncbi:hypothetical protein [Nocardia sp. CA-120079]|uniref:hypothetical protein n=1 Tax=Nocardia sp. CA-120079 TaxID=3239974 RepID=UPI003D97A4D1
MRLADRVAIITAAAAGIGRVGAEVFAAQGAWLVLNDVDQGGRDETVRQVLEAGGTTVDVSGDSSTEQRRPYDRRIRELRPSRRVLGQCRWRARSTLLNIDPDNVDMLLSVNVKAPDWAPARR